MTTRYETLLHAQQAVMRGFRPARDLGFLLYGGAASALRVRHRDSIDFDFLTAAPLDVDGLIRAVPVLEAAVPLQRDPDACTVQVSALGAQERPVKLSFVGGLDFGRVGRPTLNHRPGWAAGYAGVGAFGAFIVTRDQPSPVTSR